MSGKRSITCIGNIFSYVLALVGVFACLIGCRRPRGVTAVRFAVGWAVSYLPFFLVPRTLFLYHYLIPLIFGALSYGAALDLWIGNKTVKKILVFYSMSAVIFGFVCYAPHAYGTEPNKLQRLWWRDTWTHGRPGRDEFVRYMTQKQKDFEARDNAAKEKKEKLV
jgi:dolichyl-phosphate-mannose--protein O-mannosyl transferase